MARWWCDLPVNAFRGCVLLLSPFASILTLEQKTAQLSSVTLLLGHVYRKLVGIRAVHLFRVYVSVVWYHAWTITISHAWAGKRDSRGKRWASRGDLITSFQISGKQSFVEQERDIVRQVMNMYSHHMNFVYIHFNLLYEWFNY